MGGKKTSITNHIKRIRLARTELTQAGLAEPTRQTIIAIEAQKYAPSLELAFRIAHVLGEPVEEVFQFDSSLWD